MPLAHKKSYQQKFLKLFYAGIFLSMFIFSQSAHAAFDYMFFSINGDTTISTMTQGDEFGWGSNCDIGATIHWDIWYDVNGNSTIEPATDFLLSSENMTDGSLVTDDNPTADGWIIAPPFFLTGEPGNYIFEATDLANDSSLQKTALMLAMPSPPNQFTGQISIPGITPPNAALANIFVTAESETGDEGIFLALTNSMGLYSMNVGASGTGVEFYLEPTNIDDFVNPGYAAATASGVVPNIDFTFLTAVDSVYGFVKDEFGVILPYETDVSANSFNSEKDATTKNGRYVIYFTESEKGDWYLELSSRMSPLFISPQSLEFSHDTLTSFQHDFILTTADAFIYAKITENGGLPVNNYRIEAWSEALSTGAGAISGTGSDNVASIAVSSLDASGWSVQITTWDDEFPVPIGLISTPSYNVSPGDTVAINLTDGNLIAGTITQDPDDVPVNWEEVWIIASDGFGNNYDTRANFDGSYQLYTSAGEFYVSIFAQGYISSPDWQIMQITGDTIGVDYSLNQSHCRITGTLINVPTPLDASYSVYAFTGNQDSIVTQGYGLVDSLTGTYEIFLSDGDWTIIAPFLPIALLPPDPIMITIAEAPDTLRNIEFIYTSFGSCCIGIRGNVDNDPGDEIDIADLVYLVSFMFRGGPEPICYDEANVTGDADDLDIAELVYLVSYMFRGGPAPASCP